jgi:long-chain acyl-CoA synthetase
MATILQYLIADLCSYQLEQEILDFSQGLRAIGVAPDEKLALFADNSCRWLVADQGNFSPLF